MGASRSYPPAAASPVAPGELLAGKYRVEHVIAAGGMGVVVAAQHEQLDERVAIKFLLPEALGNRETLERFGREARAAVRIKSEHVARVLDIGALEDGAPYIVMEFLDGEDLAGRLHRAGRMPVAEAVDLILQACEAIAEAHALGIIHRDLKPGNLFLTKRSDGGVRVKVLDFGVAKVDARLARANATLTAATAVLGSPLYMPPEQMRSARAADARSDVWSLGMILFEMIAGTAAFDAPTVLEMCNKIAADAPPALRDFRPDAPAELEDVIRSCLEKDPDRRQQSVVDFARAIAPFGSVRAPFSLERVEAVASARGSLASLGPASRRSAPGAVTIDAAAAAVEAQAGATAAAWGQTQAQRRPRGMLGWAIAGGVILSAALAFQILRASTSRDEAAAAPRDGAPSAAASPQPAPAPTPDEPPSGAAPDDGEIPVPPAPDASSAATTASSARARAPWGVRGKRAPAASASAKAPVTDHLFDEPK